MRTRFAELATGFQWQALSVAAVAGHDGEEATMDATDPIWRTPAVQEAAGAGLPGALIRMARIAQRLNLVQAGKLVGYSASTLSRIETGQRKLTDVTQLRRFAEVFGIPPHLFGLASDAAIPVAGASLPLAAPALATVNRTLRGGW